MDTNIMDTITSYFEEGLEKIKFELSVAKDNLITEPFVELEQLKEQFNKTKVPALPNDYQEYYQDLQKRVLPYLVNTASPRFIGHMTSVLPVFTHDLSKLVSILKNMVKIETSKSLTFLEREAISMLHHSFYNQSDSFYGIIYSGNCLDK